MNYPGSKHRLAKYLLPIMTREREGRPWVEPFVGGANMIDKVTGTRIGADINPYIIAYLISIQNGKFPPSSVTRQEYMEIKENPENFDPALAGFVLSQCSFRSFWKGGYAAAKGRNYAKRARSLAIRQRPFILGVKFICSDYRDLFIPENSLIYCDPPYAGTKDYRVGGFDYSLFWQWCRDRSAEGHRVFISELSAPEDFELIISVPIVTSLNTGQPQRPVRVEKLFKYKG